MPTWVKVAIDAWTFAAGVAEGSVFRPVNRAGRVAGDSPCHHTPTRRSRIKNACVRLRAANRGAGHSENRAGFHYS
jgi:hypothetical protein